MDAGRQPLVFGDAPQQREQLGTLIVVERRGDGGFVATGHTGELAERALTVIGQRDRVVASIVGVALANDEAPVLELVDQGNQPRSVHPERVGERPLALSRDLPEAAENPGLGRREVEPPHTLGKRGGGMRAELGEEEGDATIGRRPSVVTREGAHGSQDYR
ncbi:MAG: hypothetical protein QOF83_4172 [Solirubrobacteraceae bacterium]|nr:hypothetical protein [Solirubrobacteraceae bacterium]